MIPVREGVSSLRVVIRYHHFIYHMLLLPYLCACERVCVYVCIFIHERARVSFATFTQQLTALLYLCWSITRLTFANLPYSTCLPGRQSKLIALCSVARGCRPRDSGCIFASKRLFRWCYQGRRLPTRTAREAARP